MARPPSDRRKASNPIPEWEQGYGMTLADVTRYRVGRGPAASVVLARRAAEATRADGGTPGTSMRLHGTRLDVGGRALLLLTLALPLGGFRMVAVDGLTGGTRQVWAAASLTRAHASRRHYSAVKAVCERNGGRVVKTRGFLPVARRAVRPELPIVGSESLWASLAVRLRHDGADDGFIGQIARWALDRLDSDDAAGCVTELLDAARTDYAPLADAAGAWLRLLGYDAVHACLPEGPDVMYARQLLHFDAELLSR